MSQESADRKLDRLLVAYREACPDVEVSPNFMPNLWQRIERKQNLPFLVGRFARLFASAAAALCLAMTLLLFVPSSPGTLSYLDVLEQENPHETLAYADLDEDPAGETPWQ